MPPLLDRRKNEPMNRLLSTLLACLFGALLLQAHVAAKEAEPVGDPAVEKRLSTLAEELRCLVCQNQTLADSHAELAADLRNEIRELIRQGQTDEQIKQYLVARYGDFVLYRPPLKTTTTLLWFGPGLLMVAGLVALFVTLKRRRALIAEAPLSASDEQRAQHLLNDEVEQGLS
jgi:cytochrome c-type biogenesis protein CcmH